MKKVKWTKFVIEMTTDEETELRDNQKLDSLTNHFDTELKALVAKYEGKNNLHIEIEEITPC